MKTTLLKPAAVAALLFIAGIASYGQAIHVFYGDGKIPVSKDTLAQITLFTGKYFEGKTYLHWNVANQQADGVYLIYRSADDKEYEMIGQKQGVGVPISEPIAYYFTDEHPQNGNSFYKLIHFSINNSFMVSETITLHIETEKYLTIAK